MTTTTITPFRETPISLGGLEPTTYGEMRDLLQSLRHTPKGTMEWYVSNRKPTSVATLVQSLANAAAMFMDELEREHHGSQLRD